MINILYGINNGLLNRHDEFVVHNRNRNMRSVSLIVLLAVAFGVIVPPLIPMAAHDEFPMIGTLDVCNSAVPALSSNGEMPCMNECPCKQGPAPVIVYAEKIDLLFTHFLLASQNELPPKA